MGFLWIGGRFTTIAMPGAVYTQAFKINRGSGRTA